MIVGLLFGAVLAPLVLRVATKIGRPPRQARVGFATAVALPVLLVWVLLPDLEFNQQGAIGLSISLIVGCGLAFFYIGWCAAPVVNLAAGQTSSFDTIDSRSDSTEN